MVVLITKIRSDLRFDDIRSWVFKKVGIGGPDLLTRGVADEDFGFNV